MGRTQGEGHAQQRQGKNADSKSDQDHDAEHFLKKFLDAKQHVCEQFSVTGIPFCRFAAGAFEVRIGFP